MFVLIVKSESFSSSVAISRLSQPVAGNRRQLGIEAPITCPHRFAASPKAVNNDFVRHLSPAQMTPRRITARNFDSSENRGSYPSAAN